MPIVHYVPIEANKLKLKSYFQFYININRFIENSCIRNLK